MDARRAGARALVAGAVVAALLPGAARADTGSFDDPVGDATSVDITHVRVAHRNAVKVSVRSSVASANVPATAGDSVIEPNGSDVRSSLSLKTAITRAFTGTFVASGAGAIDWTEGPVVSIVSPVVKEPMDGKMAFPARSSTLNPGLLYKVLASNGSAGVSESVRPSLEMLRVAGTVCPDAECKSRQFASPGDSRLTRSLKVMLRITFVGTSTSPDRGFVASTLGATRSAPVAVVNGTITGEASTFPLRSRTPSITSV